MENDRVSDEELLITRSYKECKNIYRRILLQSVSPGDSMDIGKGYDDNNWLYRSSLSQCLM